MYLLHEAQLKPSELRLALAAVNGKYQLFKERKNITSRRLR